MSIVSHALAAGIGAGLNQYQSAYDAVPDWARNLSGAATVSSALERITTFVIDIAAGVGVCVFIYACIQMVLSQGQDDKMTAAKKMAMIALVGVFLALSARAIIGALWSEVGEVSLLKTLFGL
ncbi:hypothetical protein HYS30_00460 [Candidatus Peregrinibacteria bacterium]|nr:hypothetical protein [Candidatus Peregrinibacteria bacterium]MBI2117585.1 hypothetical protein [Candidatus Peregrinibacteria bacterium]MBI2523867.1 hypothetical protein [Candidatus Peregrinibacteria bacterium]